VPFSSSNGAFHTGGHNSIGIRHNRQPTSQERKLLFVDLNSISLPMFDPQTGS
jgi:hypothetical protein